MEPETIATPASVKPLSFIDGLTNIFAAPGELFENVRLTPKRTSNWLIPTIILIVVSLILGQLVMSNPSLVDQMSQMTKKQMEQRVADGKMTQEQAAQAEAMASPTSPIVTITRIVGTIIGIPLVLFLVALVYWLLGKFTLKATAPYIKVVEVVGLTLYIGLLASLVTTILVFLMNSLFASPSLALAVSDYDLDNKFHHTLSVFNIFTIWSMIVTAIGLSKLFQRSFVKALLVVVIPWVVWSAFSVLTGFRLG